MLELVDDIKEGLGDSVVAIARDIAAELVENDHVPEGTAVYEGTRWECEAFLDSYYSIQRNIVLGAKSKASDDERPRFDEMLDVLDRRVYRVTVKPLGVTESAEPRPENSFRAMRVKTALEMFDALLDVEKADDVCKDTQDVL